MNVFFFISLLDCKSIKKIPWAFPPADRPPTH